MIMIMQISLIDLPFEKFKYILENYERWLNDVNKTVIEYIEINRIDLVHVKELVQILEEKYSLDTSKLNQIISEYSMGKETKEKFISVNKNEEREKEWIVYYNQMDVGHRVKGKNYTEALLNAYEKYGAGGKITKVEEV